MTQHIRPAQAYAAVTASVATNASPPETDQRNLHKRITDLLGVKKGTTQYGSLKTTNTTQRPILIPDTVYSALTTAGVDFSDALYNSSTAEAVETATSNIVTMWNPGLHRQVILSIGDSLTEGPTGSTAYPDLNNMNAQLAFMGVDSQGLTAKYVAAEGGSYMVPDRAYTFRTTHEKSRLIFNFGHGGWRCANQSGFTYVAGSPWLDNIEKLTKLSLHSSQQLVAYIFLGTNDIAYADTAPNTGLSAVPTGAAGYTYAGSPDYFTDALSPLISALKSAYPTIKIIWQSPAARSNTASMNAKFYEMETYAIANKVALQIDVVVKSSAMPAFDPRQYLTVTADRTYYQSDSVHFTPAGYLYHKPYRAAAYDQLLGFTPDQAYAGALA